ncbi:hypothetical protein Aduo_018409 [Ancylostoma duodenale]
MVDDCENKKGIQGTEPQEPVEVAPEAVEEFPTDLSESQQKAAAAKARLDIANTKQQLHGLLKETPPSSSADVTLPRFPPQSQGCKSARWNPDHQFATDWAVHRTI